MTFDDIKAALADCESIPHDALEQLRQTISEHFPSYFENDEV